MAIRLLIPIILGSLIGGCSDSSVSKVGEVDESAPTPDPTPEPFSTDWGQWLSMAVTKEGKPAISFYDRDHGGIGFATAVLEDGKPTWTFEGVDGYPSASGLDPGDRGAYTSLAFAEDGTAWVSFYDQATKTLRYAKRHPTLHAWSAGLADAGEGASKDAGLFSAIAIAADGSPIIAHYDKGASTLRVARWTGERFEGSVFDRGEAYTADTGTEDESKDADVGQFVRLRVIDGVEYMAYYDAANGDLKLGIGSEIHVVDTEGDVGQWPDLAVRNGLIHISYQDAGNQHLKYAVGGPGDWVITTIDDAPYTGADTALYFHGNKPGIVYFEGSENDMKHAIVNSGGWSSRTFATEGAVGFHNEVIAIGDQNFVACYDYTQRSVFFSALD